MSFPRFRHRFLSFFMSFAYFNIGFLVFYCLNFKKFGVFFLFCFLFCILGLLFLFPVIYANIFFVLLLAINTFAMPVLFFIKSNLSFIASGLFSHG